MTTKNKTINQTDEASDLSAAPGYEMDFSPMHDSYEDQLDGVRMHWSDDIQRGWKASIAKALNTSDDLVFGGWMTGKERMTVRNRVVKKINFLLT